MTEFYIGFGLAILGALFVVGAIIKTTFYCDNDPARYVAWLLLLGVTGALILVLSSRFLSVFGNDLYYDTDKGLLSRDGQVVNVNLPPISRVEFYDNEQAPYYYRFLNRWRYCYCPGFIKVTHIDWQTMTCQVISNMGFTWTYQIPPEQKSDNIPCTKRYVEPYVAANAKWESIYWEFNPPSEYQPGQIRGSLARYPY